MLAHDESRVAYEILLHSPVLRDPDLIELVYHRSQAHQLAIAMREGISEDVSAVLAATEDEDIIATLLVNQTAHISENIFRDLVEISQRADALHEPLISRHDLPEDLAKKMITWVSVALRREIVHAFGPPGAKVIVHTSNSGP